MSPGRISKRVVADRLNWIKQMMKEIWREIKETGDRALEETHYFSMRFAAVGPEA